MPMCCMAVMTVSSDMMCGRTKGGSMPKDPYRRSSALCLARGISKGNHLLSSVSKSLIWILKPKQDLASALEIMRGRREVGQYFKAQSD